MFENPPHVDAQGIASAAGSSAPWARPAEQFQAELSHIGSLLRVSERALASITAAANRVSIARGAGRSNLDQHPVDPEGEAAAAEVATGLRHLSQLGIIWVWTMLETLAEDVAVNILLAEPGRLDDERFAKVRISLGKFISLPDTDRIRLVVSEAVRQSDSREELTALLLPLRLVGAEPDVQDPLRQQLRQLRAVRNVMVHRGGQIDEAFRRAYPSLGPRSGDQLNINLDWFEDAARAAQAFLEALLEKVGPLPPSEEAPARGEGEIKLEVLAAGIKLKALASPTVYVGYYDQSSGLVLIEEQEPGRIGAIDVRETALRVRLVGADPTQGVGAAFTRPPWAIVISGDIKLRGSGETPTTVAQGVICKDDPSCAEWSVFSRSVNRSVLEIRGSDAAGTALPAGVLNGAKIAVDEPRRARQVGLEIEIVDERQIASGRVGPVRVAMAVSKSQ